MSASGLLGEAAVEQPHDLGVERTLVVGCLVFQARVQIPGQPQVDVYGRLIHGTKIAL
jgi:hypothetical protein